MQYICNTYLSETFHVKHFVNTDTELQPIMVKRKKNLRVLCVLGGGLTTKNIKDADFCNNLVGHHCILLLD